MGFHGAQWQRGDFCDLCVGHSFLVGQDNAQSNWTRQCRQCPVQVHGHASRTLCFGVNGIEFTRITQSVMFACMLQPGIDGQAFEPGTETVRVPQSGYFPPGQQERLLRQIICQNSVTATAVHQLTNPRLASPHQFSEGTPVTGSSQADNQHLGATRVLVRCVSQVFRPSDTGQASSLPPCTNARCTGPPPEGQCQRRHTALIHPGVASALFPRSG